MLWALAAYLLGFWLLGLVIHLGGFVYVFGGAALALFAIDQLIANSSSTRMPPKHRPGLLDEAPNRRRNPRSVV